MAASSARAALKGISRLATEIAQNEGKAVVTATTAIEPIDTSSLAKLRRDFPKDVEEVHHQTLLFVAEELEIALGLAMEDRVWEWEYGDGDIVDTGALRDSLNITVSGNALRIFYGQEYAGIVHNGGYIYPYGNPRVIIYMPGRPWIRYTLEGGGPVPQFPFSQLYVSKFNELLKKRLGTLT